MFVRLVKSPRRRPGPRVPGISGPLQEGPAADGGPYNGGVPSFVTPGLKPVKERPHVPRHLKVPLP